MIRTASFVVWGTMRFPDTYRRLYTYGWLGWLHLSICGASGSLDVGSSMEQHVLDSAVCADGSPGVFYMATNTSSTDYVMFIQGGGACAYDEELCDEYLDDRPQAFTSTGLPDAMNAHGVLSDDPEENPLYRETLQTVLGNVSATATVVLVGSSAGGIGAFNAATWLLESFDQVSELSVVLDSSFFFDVDGTLGDMLAPLAADPSMAYSTICAEDFNGGPCCLQFNCMVQKGYYPTADDRLRGTFVLSTLQDALTGALILERGNVNSEAVESVWDVAAYAGQTETSLRNLAALYKAELSFFAPSCIDHGLLLVGDVELWMCPSGTESFDNVDALCLTDEETGALSGVEFQVTLDDVRLRLAAEISVDAWERIQVALFDSCNDINCNPTCMSELIPGTRDESESTLVWTLVLATCAVALLVLGGGLIAVVWGVRWRNRAVGIVTSALLEESRKSRDKQAPSLRRLRCFDALPTSRRWRTRSPSGIDTVPEEKQLLHNMDGEVPKGSLCALMGPSGSGKSTLLDLLTGRKAIGRCSGELMFNGKSIANQKGSYISKSGYMRAIKLTSLEGSINTKAGGLSGGLKRRLSLALELLPDRRVLFLDEPTSGLDATSSLELMTILKRLSTKVTLVVAIHQPRPELWLLFTHAILLKDGRTVYCGPADEALSSITRWEVWDVQLEKAS
ncbi:expressed unknown protein [Ectocarpus siliculosus]|uniref:ABC transporter domain-containing protein n=1 Tax=Ectocarpus siliculosus TaxID=2880 RepID=D7G376_ECTSI|nr:expressed unknown protein [Ectocarpus siliculosus]|eukprot:CBJ26923.1 expressed unknown protein [Ectocarpus siliculosus]